MTDGARQYLVGVDWGSQQHQVCILDPAGRVVREATVAHTPEALGAWVTQLVALAGAPAALAVGIEVPRGPVVELLLERGVPTYSISPRQVAAFRDCATVAGAKDDRRDAHVVAEALRTAPNCFRALVPEDPRVVQLREWSRLDAELVAEWQRLTNQLRAQWERFYPQLLTLSPAATDPWVWRLFERAPTPRAGAQLRPTVVASVVHSYRVRKWTPAAVQAALRRSPLVVAGGVTEAASAHAQYLIKRLWLVQQQREACMKQLEALLAELTDPPEPPADGGPTDAAIMRSQPGVGPKVAARLLTEAAHLWPERLAGALRAWMGLAPVTRQSGKTRLVVMRTACSHVLREAGFYWARASLKADAASRAYYERLRARGYTYGCALRAVAERLLRILLACLKSRTLYTPRPLNPSTPPC